MPTATKPPEETIAQRPNWVLPAAGVGVLLLAIVLIFTVFSGDDPVSIDDGSTSTLPEGTAAGPPAAAGTLLSRLEAGSALTFHAVYEAAVSDGGVTGDLTLELYRDDGWVRQDSTVSADGQSARTAAILDPAGTVTSCLEQEGTWVCASMDQAAVDDVFGSLAAQLTGSDVEVSTDTILDLAADCYTLADESGTSQLCISEDGIPLRITASDGTAMTLTQLTREVDRAVFTPPADPVTTEA